MISFSEEQDLKLKKLAHLVEEKSKVVNITAIRDFDGIWEKHILDSLELLNTEFFKSHAGKKFSYMDYGTGAGFPGLPLAVMLSTSKFSLVDSTRKKVEVVNAFSKELGLENVQTIWTRAEDIDRKFEIVLARAVKYLPELLRSAVEFVSRDGYIVAYKMLNEEEIKAGDDVCEELSLIKTEEYKYSLSGQDRVILIYQKPS
ncbi:16S rRNA (guanine(527)-N(7))-methyltransferase RsmG [candidate division WWE3 bacterium CG_4_9_14_0_2_um_filter_35_11]|uniref:Ribosomal RNA small subunit methyltransferase G n=1 Tax=candidate division WWE3 bacterium CG_4_9_14_0_2_um_filter_35_11 TaxID=1975077 RepID=A0A2M8EMT6_UNCKA|nr:MAG: 16S rRNA (guanine(527)-N(7))-methyltransferase RsmG [candidate division WWE3 bacterium CG10_big_fil_rev_8_21_14_0_10_35_32]PJC24050.1 MAG: 16S rRNA (guanine(527)-N(7))-methyltransferase RsmG [candidate division WWE3 bacterium CG_4_9_14_0_2_um_filter_35_11]